VKTWFEQEEKKRKEKKRKEKENLEVLGPQRIDQIFIQQPLS